MMSVSRKNAEKRINLRESFEYVITLRYEVVIKAAYYYIVIA